MIYIWLHVGESSATEPFLPYPAVFNSLILICGFLCVFVYLAT